MTKNQRDWLIENKLDPEIYDIDAEGNVFENPIMGKLEAGARSAAASAVPALAGIPGAIAGAEGGALLGAPLGPIGVAAGSVIGGLIGGFGTSYGASKAQEALLEKYSPETIQKLSQAQEEQPVASYVGGFAPTALTARPSLKGLSELGRPLTRQTTLREAITKPGFVEPAVNVAANVAQATGQQVADVAQGGEFSGGRLAADVALGTLFNRPTKLGRKLGMSEGPQEGPVQKLDLERARLLSETPEEFTAPREERLGIGKEKVAPEQFFGTETEQRNRPISEERAAKQYENWWKSETEPTETLIKEAANSVKLKIPKERIQELANDPDVARVISDPTTLPEFVAKQYEQRLEDAYQSLLDINKTSESMVQGLAQEQVAEAKRAQTRQKELQRLGIKDIPPESPEMQAKMREYELRQTPEYLGQAIGAARERAAAFTPEGGVRVAPEKWQAALTEKERLKAALGAEQYLQQAKQTGNAKAIKAAQDIYDSLYSRLQRQGEGAKITQADIDSAAKIAARRNLTIELDRPFAGSTEVRGMYLSDPNTGNRIVRVNPLMATADTAIHEIGHDVFQGVTNPSMRKSLLESAQDSPAYKSELLARNAEVQEGKLTPKRAQELALEEGLIQAFGEQIPNIQRSEIRSWFKAFKASTKQLFTGKVSPEDAIAWMHYATTESVPWKGVNAPKATEQRFQRGEEQKTRSFAGRVAEAEQLPTEVRETVGQSSEAQYTQQNVAQVADRASAMSLSELNADLADSASNTRVASGMEIFSRQLNSGDMTGASKTALALAKSGTTWGQLINQFKLLNSSTPEGLVRLVQDSLAAKKRPEMTQQQAAILMDGANKLKLANDEVLAAGQVARDAFAANDVAAINQSIKQLDLADAKRSEVDVILNEQLAKINPADAADLFISMVQGSVMGPISIVRNVVGNAINYPLRELGDAGAAAIDATFSKDKNNSYNRRARTIDRIDAIGRSLPAALKTLLKGSNAMPYELGTDSGNPLNFQRAWRRIAEDMAAGKIGSALSARNLTEATVGILPDIMLRLTQATDIPFKQAERARIIGEIGRQKGLSEAQIQIAMRDPKLAFVTDAEAQRGRKGFSEDDLATIASESAKAVFQQDNTATQAVAGINRFIKDKLGATGYVPYRLISLFQKTPINVAAEALQFTPAGALQNWSKMTPRERNIAASRIAIGAMITTAFGYLYHKGAITPNLDTPGETNKARELAKAGGVMPPGTINLSAVKRLVSGGKADFQGGDTVVDLSSLGTAGALGIMAGSALRQAERGRTNEELATSVFKAVPQSGLNFVMEQQFLKGTSDFLKLLSQESTSSMDRWIKNFAVTAASPVAPAILGSMRRAERDKLPVIGGQSFIKDTVDELNQRYAALGLAIPGAKDPNAMPVRRDLWGDAVEQTPKGSNPWVYQFFNAWKARDIDADPLNTSIYSIWRRTADNSAIPSVPNPSLTWKQKTYDRMEPEQYDRYSELVGKYRRLFAEQEFMRPRFQQGGDERKLKLLQRAYDDGLLVAKKQFVRELTQSGQTLTPIAARRGFQQPSE